MDTKRAENMAQRFAYIVVEIEPKSTRFEALEHRWRWRPKDRVRCAAQSHERS